MAWTLSASGSAVVRAGTHANSDIIASGSALAAFSNAAEGKICAECNRDFVTDFSTFSSQIQNALDDICTSLIAMDIIDYDITGYLRREADTLMNFNDDRANKGLKILKEKENQGFP